MTIDVRTQLIARLRQTAGKHWRQGSYGLSCEKSWFQVGPATGVEVDKGDNVLSHSGGFTGTSELSWRVLRQAEAEVMNPHHVGEDLVFISLLNGEETRVPMRVLDELADLRARAKGTGYLAPQGQLAEAEALSLLVWRLPTVNAARYWAVLSEEGRDAMMAWELLSAPKG